MYGLAALFDFFFKKIGSWLDTPASGTDSSSWWLKNFILAVFLVVFLIMISIFYRVGWQNLENYFLTH